MIACNQSDVALGTWQRADTAEAMQHLVFGNRQVRENFRDDRPQIVGFLVVADRVVRIVDLDVRRTDEHLSHEWIDQIHATVGGPEIDHVAVECGKQLRVVDDEMSAFRAAHQLAGNSEGLVDAIDPGAAGIDDQPRSDALGPAVMNICHDAIFLPLDRHVVECPGAGIELLSIKDQFKTQAFGMADLAFVVETGPGDVLVEPRNCSIQPFAREHLVVRHDAEIASEEIVERQAEPGDQGSLKKRRIEGTMPPNRERRGKIVGSGLT